MKSRNLSNNLSVAKGLNFDLYLLNFDFECFSFVIIIYVIRKTAGGGKRRRGERSSRDGAIVTTGTRSSS